MHPDHATDPADLEAHRQASLRWGDVVLALDAATGEWRPAFPMPRHRLTRDRYARQMLAYRTWRVENDCSEPLTATNTVQAEPFTMTKERDHATDPSPTR